MRVCFAAALILYAAALFAPFQDITLNVGQPDVVETVHGYFLAAFGWLGPLELRFAWFANVPLVACAMRMVRGLTPWRRWAFCAACLALTVLLPAFIPDVGQGGHHIGYIRGPSIWLWLSPFAIVLVAAYIGQEDELSE
jgi:hypothetical protein